MQEFIEAVIQYPFMQNALLTTLLASIACGIMGSFVVVKRITYIAGAIAHSVLGGMGFARYVQVVLGIKWFNPILGALFSAFIAAIIIGMVSIKSKQREDTVIGAIWAMGMAIGIFFISQTPGFSEDLMSYLFGNILIVSTPDLIIIAILDFIIIGLVIIFYRHFLAVCFDEEFAKIRGLNTTFYYLLLLTLIAFTVVLLVTIVGIVMVIALITLPAAISGSFTKTLWSMMLLAILMSAIFSTTGLAISFWLDIPTGATIILVAGIMYFISLALKKKTTY